MKKILFISAYKTTFVEKDRIFLTKNFPIEKLNDSESKIRFLLRILKKIFRCGLVFCWFADSRAFISVVLSRILRKKSIVVIGGYELADLPEYNYGALTNSFSRWRVRKILLWSDRILVVDESLKSRAEELSVRKLDSIQTFPTGYDRKYFKPEGEKEDLILTVAAVTEISKAKLKGLDIFVKAAEEFPENKFIVIGIGDKVKKWLSEFKPENAEFMGEVSSDELLTFYQKAKVYCQLSCWEGLPNALCEAMLCECVPVGTRINGIPAAIGETGFYVEFSNLQKTKSAISKALKSSKGRSARQRIIRLFPQDSRQQKLIEIIRNV